MRLPDEFFLSVVLEKGRAVLEAEEHEALKLVTPEAEIRGQGRAVVRRESGRTLVTCVSGRFLVEARGRGVSLVAGTGHDRRRPAARRRPAEDAPAPPAEEGLWPGHDPVYAEPGEALDLALGGGCPGLPDRDPPGRRATSCCYQRDVGPAARPGDGPLERRLPLAGGRRATTAASRACPRQEGLICVDLVE